MFFLQFQEVFEARSRIIVYFLLGCITPLILILFWRGVKTIPGWTSAEISSYYLFVIILGAVLMCHQEDHVADIDIKEGGLTAYLLKPYSYLKLKFLNEICYRLLQGIIGSIVLLLFIFLFPSLFVIANSPQILLLSFVVAINALALTFLFKMIVGLLAFWMTETTGVFETTEVILTLTSGILMPLTLLPLWLEKIVYFLPFAYMIYFPVTAFEGRLPVATLVQVIGVQFMWIIFFYIFYKNLWRAGVKKYTAVGQ
jgi:ABC-2 type transport system permease protein